MNPKLLVVVSVMHGITSTGDLIRMQRRVPRDVGKLLDHADNLLGKFHIAASDSMVLNQQQQFAVQQVDDPGVKSGEQYQLLSAKLPKISADIKKIIEDTLAKYGSANANNRPLPARSAVDTLILHMNDVAWDLTSLHAAIVFFPEEAFRWEFVPVDPRTLRCAILNPPIEEVLKDVVCRGCHFIGDAPGDLFDEDTTQAQTLISLDHPLGQITHVMTIKRADAIRGFRTRVSCRVSGKRGEPAKVIGEIVFS